MNVNNIYHTTQRKHSPQILTDFRLWSTLFTHMPAMPQIERSRSTRLTKAEAFFDLVNRKRLSLITHDESFVNDSVQTLAQSWGWNRKAARSFLDELVLTGAISLCSIAHKTVVRLNTILVDPQHASQGVAQHGSPDIGHAIADREKPTGEPSEYPDGHLIQPLLKYALDGP